MPRARCLPGTVCDFSLMNAIESGIVKLPRVPVVDNISGSARPTFRTLWDHIRPDMPTGCRHDNQNLDPLSQPTPPQTTLKTLYGHSTKVYASWEAAEFPYRPALS